MGKQRSQEPPLLEAAQTLPPRETRATPRGVQAPLRCPSPPPSESAPGGSFARAGPRWREEESPSSQGPPGLGLYWLPTPVVLSPSVRELEWGEGAEGWDHLWGEDRPPAPKGNTGPGLGVNLGPHAAAPRLPWRLSLPCPCSSCPPLACIQQPACSFGTPRDPLPVAPSGLSLPSIILSLSHLSVMLASVDLTRKQPPELNSMALHQLRAGRGCVMRGEGSLASQSQGGKQENHIDSPMTAVNPLLPAGHWGDGLQAQQADPGL